MKDLTAKLASGGLDETDACHVVRRFQLPLRLSNPVTQSLDDCQFRRRDV